MLPNLCIADAKTNLLLAIERQNRIKLKDKGIKLSYNKGFTTSWLSIDIVVPKTQEDIEKHI